MNLKKEKEFRPYIGGYYMISSDGYIYVTTPTKGRVPGRFLLPIWQSGTATYGIRRNGRPKSTSMSTILLEVWGQKAKIDPVRVNEMRAVITRYHEKYLPQVCAPRAERLRKIEYEKKNPASTTMPCPWASKQLTTPPSPGYGWDSAEADPMTMRVVADGVWVEVRESETKRRAAA